MLQSACEPLRSATNYCLVDKPLAITTFDREVGIGWVVEELLDVLDKRGLGIGCCYIGRYRFRSKLLREKSSVQLAEKKVSIEMFMEVLFGLKKSLAKV